MTPSGSDQSSAWKHRERPGVATQACQTCRLRKSKCDEERPRCGLCVRVDAECHYREPLPTKKDKTLVQILEQVTNLGIKVDASNATTISNFESLSENIKDIRTLIGHSQQHASDTISPGSPESAKSVNYPKSVSSMPAQGGKKARRLTAPHKVLLWPCIYDYLTRSGIPAACDLQAIRREGTTWFVNLEQTKHFQPLPADDRLPSFQVNGKDRVAFPTLSIQRIRDLSESYFDTFNLLLPILDKDDFLDRTVPALLAEGFSDDDPNGVLTLMVLALGEVTMKGVMGPAIDLDGYNGKQSGLRGGTREQPPGLGIYNEARRRLGFVSGQCSLELVQILLLQAVYLESSARHLEYWKSAISASETCQVLIKCQSIDWSTRRGDLIKRAFWSCILTEDLFHLELDLPLTSIYNLEDDVPWPYSQTKHTQLDAIDPSDEKSHYQYSFLAMIHLRKLITRVHSTIHDCELITHEQMPSQYNGPPFLVIDEMNRQLHNWRTVLPEPLQWSDDTRFQDSAESCFHSHQRSGNIATHIVTAQLRTRYYYARYLIHRPLIYKALHFAQFMTVDDTKRCAVAIESACFWPISLSPSKDMKRLIPNLFAFTQHFVGILLILRMTIENPFLRSVCEQHSLFDVVERTSVVMLDWIRDLRQIDSTAEWAWGLVSPLYGHWRAAT